MIITILIVLLVIAALAVVGFASIKPAPDTVQGMGDATEIRISGKLPGRVAELYVEEGARVNKGDTLVRIHSSVVEAQLGQAQAMETVAQAQNKKVDAGTRIQIIKAASDMVRTAEAAVSISKKTYDRMERLFNEGVVPEQKRDEAKAAYDAAVAQRDAAASQL